MTIAFLLIIPISQFSTEGNGINDENKIKATPKRGSADPSEWTMYMGDLTHQGYSPSPIPMKNDTKILWGNRIDQLLAFTSPVVWNGVVYVGSGNGYMRGFDIDTGEEVFSVNIGSYKIQSAAAIDNGTIYFGASNGHLYGFRISDSAKVTDVNLQGRDIFSSPLIFGNRAYIGVLGASLNNHRFHAVDLSTNSINWTLTMDEEENFYGFKETAAYHNGRIYIGEGNGTFYCLDENGFWDGNDGYLSETNTSLTSPDIIWKWENPIAISTDPMIAEGKVYFGIVTGDLYCLDADTGSELWTKEVGRGERGFQSCPAYKDGRVYTTARNYYNNIDGASVFSLDASTGRQIWRFNITGQVITESSPIVVDGALVFGSRNKKLYCISTIEENIADEDRIIWTNITGFRITSTPAVADGRIFVSTEPISNFGKLIAIGAPDPRINNVWISDPAPFEGERVTIGAGILNNATVDCTARLEFTASTFNNSRQEIIGSIDNVTIPINVKTVIEINWTVESGFDFFAVFIKDVIPEDRNLLNNFGSEDLLVRLPLTNTWTTSGSGPGRRGGAGESLDSNRSFWSLNLENTWEGDPESIFYEGFHGNGSISASGAAIYLSDPSGDLVAYNTTPDADGKPGLFWRYSNSSVTMLGRPVILADRDQTFSGFNRIFSYGDDGAIWAFDWAGFRDGENDGPYIGESITGATSGDVVWRTQIPSPPSMPLTLGGGNLIVASTDGNLRGIDDDTGNILWSRPIEQTDIILSDMIEVFIVKSDGVEVVDPNTGDLLRSMGLNIPYDSRITSASLVKEGLLVQGENTTSLYDNDLSDGIDEGIKDNSTDSDLIWTRSFELPIESPPSISPVGGLVGLVSGGRVWFHHLTNGTEISNLTVFGQLSGRIISGGDSFYLVTGSAPWTVRSFVRNDLGKFEPAWTLELESEPRGELVVEGNHMYISLKNGMILSIGADNNPPLAKIQSPGNGIMVFPDEVVTLDATGSTDLEGDPLTYVWTLEGIPGSLYEGPDSITNVILSGVVGRKNLILRVYDDMRAFGEASVNVTVLKRITSPDFQDFLYDINVHMSYGISEASGRGLINVSVPSTLPERKGTVFVCSLDFVTWPVYAQYRFEWANVTIGYGDKEFRDRIHEKNMGVFYLDGEVWKKAPESGVDLENKSVYGNFSSLRSGTYAIGILDNNAPELRHHPTDDYRFKMMESTNYRFRIEYRDADNDLPLEIKLVIDNRSEYILTDEGFASSVTRYTFHSVSNVELEPGEHSYYFEADDGYFIIRTGHYDIEVGNNPPVVNILGPTSIVRTGDDVLFDGSGSYDPDGDDITFSWDFDNRDGIQREDVDPKVTHVYLEEGNYIVTLTVSDNSDETSRTISITVLDEDENGSSEVPTEVWLGIIVVMGILILAIVIFIVISRRGHEEQTDLQKKFEGRWTCPECGTRVPNGVEECPTCDYIYDPMDFEDEDELEFDELDEM